MVFADWGVSGPPLVLFDGQLSAPRSDAVVADLPEVRAALADGWFLAPANPTWVYVPALWPRFARAWLPDRSTHYMIVACTGQPTRRVPWTSEVAAEMEQDANSDLQLCGLPARPPNRIWLLRPPPQYPDVEHTMGHLVRAARHDGVDAPMLCPEMVEVAARELRTLFMEANTPNS